MYQPDNDEQKHLKKYTDDKTVRNMIFISFGAGSE